MIIQYNTQYKNEYYYSGINPVDFRGHNNDDNKDDDLKTPRG